jgi:hypothetical protein
MCIIFARDTKKTKRMHRMVTVCRMGVSWLPVVAGAIRGSVPFCVQPHQRRFYEEKPPALHPSTKQRVSGAPDVEVDGVVRATCDVFNVSRRQSCVTTVAGRMLGMPLLGFDARTIDGVTLDPRLDAMRTVCGTFDDWIARMPIAAGGRPVVVGNVGCSGSGKTTSLQLAMRHFILHVDGTHREEHSDTHAIYITFNDGQQLLPLIERDLEPGTRLALRVLHRAVVALGGPELWGPFLNKALSCGPLQNCELEHAVRAARSLLAMPPAAHLLLAADELRNCSEEEPSMRQPKGPSVYALQALCRVLDASFQQAPGSGVNYCVVSTYGAVDPIKAYTQMSKRGFRIMSLPPLWPLDDSFIQRGGDDLPAAVRKLLPGGPLERPRSKQEVELILALFDSAGHPRRVQELLAEIKRGEGSKGAVVGTDAAHERYSQAMNAKFKYADALNKFRTAACQALTDDDMAKDPGKQRRTFAKSLAQLFSSLFFPFDIPTSEGDRELRAPELVAQFSGLCQAMPYQRSAIALFMPHPALRLVVVEEIEQSVQNHELFLAMTDLSSVLRGCVPGAGEPMSGKPLESLVFHLVWCVLVAHHARPSGTWDLSKLLREYGSHPAFTRRIARTVPKRMSMEFFPGRVHGSRVEWSGVTVADLKQQCVFQPTAQFNPGADVFAVLQPIDAREKHVLVCFQCKEWTKDTVQGRGGVRSTPLESWRQGWPYFEKDAVRLRDGGDVRNEAFSKLFNTAEFRKDFDVVHVLVTVSPVRWPREGMGEARGAMDLESIGVWCPTVGYNAIGAYKAWKLYYGIPPDEGAGS